MTCATCDLDLQHCHALLVEHPDGTSSCLDGCGGPRLVHDERATCAELALGCCVLLEVAAVVDDPPALPVAA